MNASQCFTEHFQECIYGAEKQNAIYSNRRYEQLSVKLLIAAFPHSAFPLCMRMRPKY